jgi:hypothetical protein
MLCRYAVKCPLSHLGSSGKRMLLSKMVQTQRSQNCDSFYTCCTCSKLGTLISWNSASAQEINPWKNELSSQHDQRWHVSISFRIARWYSNGTNNDWTDFSGRQKQIILAKDGRNWNAYRCSDVSVIRGFLTCHLFCTQLRLSCLQLGCQ